MQLRKLILDQLGTGLTAGVWHPELVKLLQTVRYVPEADHQQGTVMRPRRERLDYLPGECRPDPRGYGPVAGRFEVPYGLREYLAYAWSIRGGDSDARIWNAPHALALPSFENQPADFPRDPGLLEFLNGQDSQGVDLRSGLIRYAPQRVHAVDLLLEIARAWPEMLLVVACPTQKRAWQVVNYLRSRGQDARVAGEKVDSHDARITVGTIAGICHATRGGGWKYGFVFSVDVDRVSWLLEDPHPVTWLSPIFLPTAFPKARHFGFLPMDFQGTQYQRDMLRGMFGFHEYCIPAHGMTPLDFRVVRVKPRNETALPVSLIHFELKRQGVWFNKLRNRQVVGLAKKLVSNDLRLLAVEFPKIAAAVGGPL